MKIFLICPVRNATPQVRKRIETYVENLENRGNSVYYPARDTDQKDDTGFRICSDNREAIFEADEVHIFWDSERVSQGSLFDLGVAFAYKKPLLIANPEDIIPEQGKSFLNMICYWSFLEKEDL